MKIGICDDNPLVFEEVIHELEEYMKSNALSCEFYTFRTVDSLLACCRDSDIKLDLLFMDIEMPEMTGIEVCKEVNRLQPECKIAYHTNYLSYAPEVYETKHCYFILKGQLKERLPYVICKVLEEKDKAAETILLDVHGGKEILRKNEILYMERDRKKTYIVLENGCKAETNKKLSELLEDLVSSGFVRCHNSYVVSFSKVKKYTRQELTVGDKKIPISRKYISTVKEQFLKWCGTQF